MNKKKNKQAAGRIEPIPATPPRRGRLNRSAALFDADVAILRENPGQWMLVRQGYSTRAGADPYLNRGCRASTRRNPDGTFDVYARWPEPRPELPRLEPRPEPARPEPARPEPRRPF